MKFVTSMRLMYRRGKFEERMRSGPQVCLTKCLFQVFITEMDINDRKRGVFTPDEEAVRMVFALTERERQVLVLIADGRSTKEAAARLGISYKTADSHRSRILEKLGIHETASMVRYAIRAGLIAP